MPIGRLELAEFGRFVPGQYRCLKWADFAAKTGCADFAGFSRTQSINQPSNNMGVRRLCSKNGVRRFCGVFSYSINQSTIE